MRIPLKFIALAMLFTAVGAAEAQSYVKTAPTANQPVTSGGYPLNWNTAASSSTANMFVLTDSSTASAPSGSIQPGHLQQVITGSSSYLNPFSVYSQTVPNSGSAASNASFEVTNGLYQPGNNGVDAHLLDSKFVFTSPPSSLSSSSNQLEMNGYWFAPGIDSGVSGTTSMYWTSSIQNNYHMTVTQRGIADQIAADMDKAAIGDTVQNYSYLTAFGGEQAGSDEGVLGKGQSVQQRGFVSGVITSGATTGSILIGAGSTTCTGYCQQAYSGNYFSDGGILLDTQNAGITATVVDCNAPGGTNAPCNVADGFGGMSFDISGATVTPSTAWGNIIPSSCTNNGEGGSQTYTSTTCNVTLVSGTFNTSSNIFLSGPFEEEAAVTAAGTPSGGVQSITFSTRYAWDNANGNTDAALVMQGGPGGQSLIVTGTNSWPVAYFVIGATTSTRIYFSNCLLGRCDGSGSYGNAPNPNATPAITALSLSRASNVVSTVGITNGQNAYVSYYPVGSSIVVSGWSDASFDGTYTVATNTMNKYDTLITWNQTASNSTATGGAVYAVPMQITLYPSAFIIGTNNGQIGVAQLGTNHVPFATNDTVVGAPAAEFHAFTYGINQGQYTADDPASLSEGYVVGDTGPSPMYAEFAGSNNQLAPVFMEAGGRYSNVLDMYYRPANNGAILYTVGNNPVAGTGSIPYYVFVDDASGGALIHSPASHSFSFNEPLGVTGLANTGTTALGSAGQATVDISGNIATSGAAAVVGLTDTGTTNLHQQIGPATAPSGSCSTNGAWVFSQDGHATFCASGTWITKI